ncbi:MAG TPA: LysR family transcriptional regulator [Umezawaea sp.]|nr:LysR family transcriptional regulator [Umezawaea sp.]
MNLRQMECFLAVADELHFRRAADRLRLAPPSVSEAVAGLERSLGGRLVERTSRRVRLTPLGAEFAAAIRPPMEALNRAHRTTRLRSAHPRDLVIAHTPELGPLILPALGETRWRPVTLHTTDQLAAVTTGEVDVGLCWSVPDQPGITSTVLGEFPLVAVLRATDPLASRHAVAFTDLRTRRLLVTPRADNPYLDSRLRADVLRAGIPPAHVEEVGRYDELAVHVAAHGHVGVHPGPITFTNPLPTIVFRPITDASDTARICAITRSDAPTGTVAALIADLRTIVGALGDHA